VTDHGLARDTEARLHIGELPVTVRRLVEVHEVEVNLRPGELDVGLRVQVEQGLAQGVEAGDPHLGRAEGVHPRDDPDDVVAGVGVEREPADAVGVGEHGLPHDPHRGVGEMSCHLLRLSPLGQLELDGTCSPAIQLDSLCGPG